MIPNASGSGASRGRRTRGNGVSGSRARRSRNEPGQSAGAGESNESNPLERAPGHPEDDPGDPEQVARTVCLRLLTDRPRTRQELADALRAKDVPDEAAEAVLHRFGEVGLINDAAFAESWVDSRHRGRGLARRALATELHRKGVESETAREALDALTPEQERETAERLVRRRLPSTRRLAPEARTRRLLGMLARKGYPAGMAASVIRDAISAEAQELDETYADELDTLADSDD